MNSKEQLQIKIPALKRPTLEDVQKSWSYIKSIESDESTEKAVTLNLASVLKDGEDYIKGSEYESRLKAESGKLGFQHREWLLEHQNEFPEFMALLGKVYIDFPGIVVVDGDGRRNVPYCGRDGARWVGRWDWLDYGFGSDGRIAVGGKVAKTQTLKSSASGLSPSIPLDLEKRVQELEKDMAKLKEVIKF